MASDDPEFERKAADIIGLYLHPPQHAAVFCVDEKSAIQALDRLDPVLPMSPGRAERHGFEYYRHGTLSLYAALDVRSGKVHGKTAARHTSDEFVDFLEQMVGLCKPKQEIHVILDNLSAHKTQKVASFLQQHPNVKLHFTPTYSSWLNQVEIWFSRIERDVIARGVFSSVSDLARKLIRYIRAYSKNRPALQLEVFRPTPSRDNMLTNSPRQATSGCKVTSIHNKVQMSLSAGQCSVRTGKGRLLRRKRIRCTLRPGTDASVWPARYASRVAESSQTCNISNKMMSAAVPSNAVVLRRISALQFAAHAGRDDFIASAFQKDVW